MADAAAPLADDARDAHLDPMGRWVAAMTRRTLATPPPPPDTYAALAEANRQDALEWHGFMVCSTPEQAIRAQVIEAAHLRAAAALDLASATLRQSRRK